MNVGFRSFWVGFNFIGFGYPTSLLTYSKRGSSFGDGVRELDNAIGAILNLIIQNGLANNTLVIFTSDNGAALVSRQKGIAIFDNSYT